MRRSLRAALSLAATGTVLVACTDLPSRSDVLDIVKHEVKEEALCTLPVGLLSSFRPQYTTGAICVPKEGGEKALACLDALVGAGLTKRMPPAYMTQWPDEISGIGFDYVSPYDRRARELLFRACFELTPGLREGQFRCGDAKADSIVSMNKTDDTHAVVRYAREIKNDPHLAEIEAACGEVTHPAPQAILTIVKTSDKKWKLAPSTAASASPSSAPR